MNLAHAVGLIPALIYHPTTTATMVNPLPQDLPSSRRISFTSIENKINDQCCCRRSRHRNDDAPSTCTMSDLRDEIFHLGAIVGRLCPLFLNERHHHSQCDNSVDCAVEKEQRSVAVRPFWEEHPSSSDNAKTEVVAAHHQLGQVFLQLFVVSRVCAIDLCTSILKKVELNGRKYPVELCKGKSGKYTNYSEHTGITTTEGQSTIDSPIKTSSHGDNNLDEDSTTTIEGMTMLIRNFANERQWHRYHTPRNIALALLGEVGELAELFQWSGDEGLVQEVVSEETLDKAGQEIADVSIYLLRLCDVCHVPLGEVMMELLDATEGRHDG